MQNNPAPPGEIGNNSPIERSCVMQESEQKTMGVEQVNQVLKTIVNLKNIVPNLMIML